MSGPLVVSVPHRLGKDEALPRLKNGLGSVSANFSHVFKVEEQTCTGPHLQYRISALGQAAHRLSRLRSMSERVMPMSASSRSHS